jgi:hypothetical protein
MENSREQLHDANEKAFRQTLDEAANLADPSLVNSFALDIYNLIRRRIDRGYYDPPTQATQEDPPHAA